MQNGQDEPQWFVLRDLKRPNALMPAYKELAEMGLHAVSDFFTPMTTRVVQRQGKSVREECAFIPDLLFLHTTKQKADEIVGGIPTLQYRYVRGGYRQPMVVDERAMNRFLKAVSAVATPQYFAAAEITEAMVGRQVRIVGGQLDGYKGKLLKCRGSHKRRLLVAIPNLLVAAVEVQPEFVEII